MNVGKIVGKESREGNVIGEERKERKNRGIKFIATAGCWLLHKYENGVLSDEVADFVRGTGRNMAKREKKEKEEANKEKKGREARPRTFS